jgi:hypothetical protein
MQFLKMARDLCEPYSMAIAKSEFIGKENAQLVQFTRIVANMAAFLIG